MLTRTCPDVNGDRSRRRELRADPGHAGVVRFSRMARATEAARLAGKGIRGRWLLPWRDERAVKPSAQSKRAGSRPAARKNATGADGLGAGVVFRRMAVAAPEKNIGSTAWGTAGGRGGG